MKTKTPSTKPIELIQQFEQGLQIFDSPQQRLAREFTLRELSSLATTFDHWLTIFYRTKKGSALERDSLSNLAELPASKKQLLDVLEFAPIGELRELVTIKLTEQGFIHLNGHERPFNLTSKLSEMNTAYSEESVLPYKKSRRLSPSLNL